MGQGFTSYTALNPLGSMNSWLSHGNLAGLKVSARLADDAASAPDMAAIGMKGQTNIGWPSPFHL